MSRLLRTMLRVLGMAWTLPNTALGLVAGLAGIGFGARAHLDRRNLALVFQRWPWGPGGAITLGNVILHTGETLQTRCATYAARAAGTRDAAAIVLADHERAHVLQYMLLGPFFLPAYLLCGGISAGNPFERAADRYAAEGHGWWPWRIADERSPI